MDTIQYLSMEWVQEAKNRLQAQVTPETLKQMTTSVLIIVRNCPDGYERGVLFQVNNGFVDEVTIPLGNLPLAEFIVTCDYATFVRIMRAELSTSEAMMKGLIQLQGNMLKALTLVPIVDRLNGILSQIPCEF